MFCFRPIKRRHIFVITWTDFIWLAFYRRNGALEVFVSHINVLPCLTNRANTFRRAWRRCFSQYCEYTGVKWNITTGRCEFDTNAAWNTRLLECHQQGTSSIRQVSNLHAYEIKVYTFVITWLFLLLHNV